MFLYAVIAFAVAVGLMQLGALSVSVTILSLMLKIVLAVILGVALYFAVRNLRRRY